MRIQSWPGLVTCREVKKRGSRRLIDRESQVGCDAIGEEIDVQFGIARAQSASEGLVVQDQLAARKADVLEIGRCPACLRVGQEIEHRVDVDIAGARILGDPREADAAVCATD